MNVKIIAEESIIEGEEITIWKLSQDDGAIVFDLNKLLDLYISECYWIDEDKKFIILQYGDWDDSEYFAILNNNGSLIKKGIREFEYIKKENLFIALFNGSGLSEEEATYYNVGSDDFKMAVFNSYGKYVMPPQYNSIKYYDDEDVFYADGNVYAFNGSFIKKDN